MSHRALLPLLLVVIGASLLTVTIARRSTPAEAAPIRVAEASVDLLVPDGDGMSPLRVQMLLEVPAELSAEEAVEEAIASTIDSVPGAVAAAPGSVSAQFVAAGWTWEPPRVVWSYNDTGRSSAMSASEAYEAFRAATETWNEAGAAFEFWGGFPTGASPTLCGGLIFADSANTVGWVESIGGTVLARTCTTPASGPFASESDIQFDASRKWTLDEEAIAIDFQSVALHELGHVLGLGHTAQSNAVMYGIYAPGALKRQLEADDLAGLYQLYGQATPTPSPTSTPSATSTPTPTATPAVPPLPLEQQPLFAPGLSAN